MRPPEPTTVEEAVTHLKTIAYDGRCTQTSRETASACLHLIAIARDFVGMPAAYRESPIATLARDVDFKVAPHLLGVAGRAAEPATRERIRSLVLQIQLLGDQIQQEQKLRTEAEAKSSPADLQRIESLTRELETVQGRLGSLGQQLQDAMAEARLAKDSLGSRLQQYQQDLEQAQRNYDLMQDMHNDQVAANAVWATKAQAWETQAGENAKQRDALAEQLTNAEASIGVASSDLARLKQDLLIVRGDLESARADLGQRDAQMLRAQRQYEDSLNQLAQADQARLAAQASASELTAKNLEQSTVIAQLLTDLGAANTQLQAEKADYIGLQRVLDETVAELQSVRASTSASLSNLSTLALSQSMRVDQLTAEVNQLQATAQTATTYLSNLLIVAGQGMPVNATVTASLAREWLGTNPLSPAKPKPITNQEQ